MVQESRTYRQVASLAIDAVCIALANDSSVAFPDGEEYVLAKKLRTMLGGITEEGMTLVRQLRGE